MTRCRCRPHTRSESTGTPTQGCGREDRVTLLPVEYVDLDADHERRAVELLADLIADTHQHRRHRQQARCSGLTSAPQRAVLDPDDPA